MILFFMTLLIGTALLASAILLIPLLRSNNLADSKNSFENKFLAVLLFLLIPLLSVGFYYYFGNGKIYLKWLAVQEQEKQQAKAVEKLRGELGTPDKVIEKMKQQLAEDPRSVQGWYLLGRLYLSLNRYQEAASAFAKANHLQPDNVDIQLQYAQSLYFAHNFSLAGEPQQLINEILSKNPHQLAAVNLLAIDAYHQKQFNKAISLWQQMLGDSSLNEENRKSIEQAITSARTQ